ncbi:hypothetical protein VTK26DRAFT_6774 [Humicola hyalothermophila]
MSRVFSSASTKVPRIGVNKRIGRFAVVAVVFLLGTASLAWTLRGHDATGFFFGRPGITTRWSIFGGDQTSPPAAFSPFETTSAFSPVSHTSDTSNASIADLCASFPHYLTQQRIQPVLKMGHGENRATIKAQFASVSACFSPDELLVFSDLPEDPIPHGNGHRAIDLLATLPASYRESWEEEKEKEEPSPDGTAKAKQTRKPKPNPDLLNYDRLTSLSRAGQLTPDNDPARGRAGWALDKYKFLAGVERAWAMRPRRDFYVFYETDTYVAWDSLFRLLSALDPAAPLYLGSPSPGRRDAERAVDTWFANGGPGFVLSRGAMKRLLERRAVGEAGQFVEEPLALRWGELLKRDPCGDSVLGWALWHAGVKLSGLFPLFNVYAASGLPYTERLWCQPFVTMHKLSAGDMVRLWRWENARRTLGRPLLYRDLFDFLPVAVDEVRENWDNTVWDRLAPGEVIFVGDVDTCRQACRDRKSCFQWHYQGNDTRRCVLMRFVSHGAAKEPEIVQTKVPVAERVGRRDGRPEGDQQFKLVEQRLTYTSGWVKSRISRWVESHRCAAPEWVSPSIERHY